MDPEAINPGCGNSRFLKHCSDAFDSRRGRHRLVQQGLSLGWVFEVRVGRYERFDRHES